MMVQQAAITLAYLLLFNALFLKLSALRLKGYKPFVTVALFNLKFIAGVAVFVIYTWYYKDVQNNDVHKYYNDALTLRNEAGTTPQLFWDYMLRGSSPNGELTALKNWDRNFDEAPVNENRTIIRLNALLMFISGRTYMAHVLFMCFISLLGWVLIYNSMYALAPNLNKLTALTGLLLPSVLLWTSGIMKEPLLVAGMGLFIAGLLSYKWWRCLGGVLAGMLIMLSIKFFALACIVPAGLAFYLFKNHTGTKFTLLKYAGVYLLCALIAFNVQKVVPTVNPVQMLANKQEHSIKEAIYFNAGSRIDIPVLQPNARSVISNIPNALHTALLRPYLWETKNPLMLANALENVLLLLLFILALLYNRRQAIHLNLLLFLLAFTASYLAITGLCTPVLGNLSRYRAPVLPVLIMGLALVSSGKIRLPGWQIAGKLKQYLFTE